MALATLSILSVDDLATAVERQDIAPFRKVPGVGPKTAASITAAMRGKLRLTPRPSVPAVPSVRADLVAALVALGWTKRASIEVADQLLHESRSAAPEPMPALLRRALALIGSRAIR